MNTQSTTVPDAVPISAAKISAANLPLVLQWWQQRKQVANLRNHLEVTLPGGDETYLQAYHRLMEVYSVVKSGGVQARTEAVRAFADRESTLLDQRLKEIETTETLSEAQKKEERIKVEHDFEELRQSNRWRLQVLDSITPEEEATVKQYLANIEQTLM